MIRHAIKVTLNRKLLIYMVLLLLATALAIGIPSYNISKKALDEKGETILENGVKSAIMLIRDKNLAVLAGTISLEEAQESIKTIMIGPMNADGRRQIDNPIDLGENGYFIVYSINGEEILHPTLEGENVWGVVDKNPKLEEPFYLVQDKIEKALGGGGFTRYTWNLPYEETLEEKVVYSEYEPNWGWVVTAGTYVTDFNKEAALILNLTILLVVFVVFLGFFLSSKYITSIATPLMTIEKAMKAAEYGEFKKVNTIKRTDEIGSLINGYNHMITSIESANRKIKTYAFYDTLTGLPNRNMLKEHVNERLKSGCADYNLILVDIKDFKVINSIYGNDYGDKIILILSEYLRRFEGNQVKFSRVAGDEFAAWVENWDIATLNESLNTMREDLNNILILNGHQNRLEFHISSCGYDSSYETFDMIYQRAGIALQFAKINSLSRHVIYEKDMFSGIERESVLKAQVETALNNQEFTLHYQSMYDVAIKSVVGVEALARWNSQALGNVSPMEFIPILNKNNLMIEFSKFVINRALDDLPRLSNIHGDTIHLSINVSPSMFLWDQFISYLTDAIQSRGIRPDRIVLEITEDIFITDFKRITSIFDQLKVHGIKIALDDFGSGYSSLNYLRNIKFDHIKIDKMFIDDIHLDQKSLNMFKTIVELAHSLNSRVIAEGVEEKIQVDLIEQSGCAWIQGYYFAKPEPLV
ncbi:MAG: EAL domain-containing protein [Bacillota bacterium]|nr:EAL domain-containing protein [Bacillota bacterium]